MCQLPRLRAALVIFLMLPALTSAARADALLERLSALRLLQIQSTLWNQEVKSGLLLSGSFEQHYTTNAALASGGTSDWYESPAAALTWSHDICGGCTASVGADAGGFRYLKHPDLGSSYVDAWAGVERDIQLGPVEAGAYITGVQQWTQLKNFSKSNSSSEILAGFKAGSEIRPGHSVSLNAMASATPYASPWDSGYHSYGVRTAYDWSVSPALEVSVFYTGYVTAYFSGQTDLTQYVGAGIAWNISEHLSISASITRTWNSSTDPGSDYSATDTGGTLGLQWRL